MDALPWEADPNPTDETPPRPSAPSPAPKTKTPGDIISDYEPVIHSTMRQFGLRKEEIDELLPDVYVIALRNFEQLKNIQAISEWLRTIVQRVAIQHFRRRKTVNPSLREDGCSFHEPVSKETSPPDAVIIRETSQKVREAVERLKPLDRQMILEFYFQRRSLREMTDIPDCTTGQRPSVANIKRRLFYARSRLQAELAHCN